MLYSLEYCYPPRNMLHSLTLLASSSNHLTNLWVSLQLLRHRADPMLLADQRAGCKPCVIASSASQGYHTDMSCLSGACRANTHVSL